MGNNVCGITEKKDTFDFDSKIVAQKIYKDVLITIVQGDILEELSNVVVNSSHDPAESQISKREKNLKNKEKLSTMKVGDLIILETNSNNISSDFIYHVKLPLYSSHQDLYKIYNIYMNCLQQASKNKLKIISFTDLTSQNFTIPKQYNAEVMIKAFINFLDQNQTEIKTIKFLSLDGPTLKMFNYELNKQFDELKVPELVISRNLKFKDFMNPPPTQECSSPYDSSLIKSGFFKQSQGLPSESDENLSFLLKSSETQIINTQPNI